MIIDIGGGTKPLPGAINLDPVHGEGAYKIDASTETWPFLGHSIDRVHASHVLEHVNAGAPRIHLFNEAHRVLKSIGIFEVFVPEFPSWQAIADPTHVSHWVEQSFWYFDGRWGPDADYGIRRWHTLKLDRPRWEWELRWIGEPV